MDPSSYKKRKDEELAMIVEMIEAAMNRSAAIGPHPLVPGCNCIACVIKRKCIMEGVPKLWRHRL